MINLSTQDAKLISSMFSSYYSKYDNISDYMREQKLESLGGMNSNILFPPESELFSDFDMHPEDMELEVVEIHPSKWKTMNDIISTHINTSPVGRSKNFAVLEKNTGKYVGFIKLGSPVINCKPRNELLGQVFTQDIGKSRRFNESTMMGFVIVPAQPFGYNYLGGKLLAAICCSHTIREQINKKYNMNLCLFETTSLYGNSKSFSQYDGMKPYLRFKGLTDSNFIPMMHGKSYDDMKKFVETRTGNLIGSGASSKKMKTIQKIIALVKSSLKGSEEYSKFTKTIDDAKKLTEQKRYYVSGYGFKNNVDYVNNDTDTLIKDDNYDKFELENVISWWKNKASKRYDNLKSEGKLRTELEIWTSGKDIDIIR